MTAGESQRDIIIKIDGESTRAVYGAGENVAPSRVILAARMILSPTAVLLRGLIIRGGALKGIPGLRDAVNGAALAFVTEAKRYEKHYGSDAALKKTIGGA